MILGWLRLMVVGFVVLSALYLLVWVYAKSVRREWLEKEWDAGRGEGTREEFVEARLATYRQGLARRLVWLIYVVPAVIFTGLFYFVNYQ